MREHAMSMSMSELARWLAERGEAIEAAHVRHTSLRLQSDSQANAIRRANDQCRCLKRQRLAKESAALLANRSNDVAPLVQSGNTEARRKQREPNASKGASSAAW